MNIHTDWRTAALLPGLAHTSYWTAKRVLRFILARAYGRAYLPDRDVGRQSVETQIWFGIAGYTVWAVLLFGGVVGLAVFRVEIVRAIWEALKIAGKTIIGA